MVNYLRTFIRVFFYNTHNILKIGFCISKATHVLKFVVGVNKHEVPRKTKLFNKCCLIVIFK